MNVEQALEVADLAAPVPAVAADALRTLRLALVETAGQRLRDLGTVTRLVGDIRQAAGVCGAFPLIDLPPAIADVRRRGERLAAFVLALSHPARHGFCVRDVVGACLCGCRP